MAELGHRRVVTGLDGEGKSAIIIDGPIPRFNDVTAALAWGAAIPADNSGHEDMAAPYEIDMLQSGHANFAICEFPANTPEVMHATDTIDYLIILSGRVTMVLEEGEADLGPGDFVVDRGVLHGWRNHHGEDCVAAVVNIPAHPVGKGRTI
jgi:mannose-6-phosphate isomerase-like protein (cupin superfamily)